MIKDHGEVAKYIFIFSHNKADCWFNIPISNAENVIDPLVLFWLLFNFDVHLENVPLQIDAVLCGIEQGLQMVYNLSVCLYRCAYRCTRVSSWRLGSSLQGSNWWMWSFFGISILLRQCINFRDISLWHREQRFPIKLYPNFTTVNIIRS